MASYPSSELATHPWPPLQMPSPSPSSEDGEAIDSDPRPILERENDDGPPAIRSPQHRHRLSLPPAPPTSRGTSFDEPLCTQNARSSADLWLVGLLFEQRSDGKDATVEARAVHNVSYCNTTLNPQLFWEDDYDSRGTMTKSSASSDQSDSDDDSADGILSWRRSQKFCTYSSLTFQSSEDDKLTAQHRSYGMENLRRLDECRSPAKEGYPFCESGNPSDTRFCATTSPVVTLGNLAAHASHAGCATTAECTINICYHGLADLSPAEDDRIKHQARPGPCKCEQGPKPRSTAEVEPMTLNRSVWDDDERDGRWTRLAASFHPLPTLRRARRKGRVRTKISKLFRCLSCCSSMEES